LLRLFVVAVVLFPLTARAIDVWGDQWGTWTRDNSPYNVIGEIWVPPESTLVIEPGVVVNFRGHYKFIVDSLATLLAVGTETDSIFFTCDTLANPNRWHGIRFIRADSNSQISYSRIEYGSASGGEEDGKGGALYCSNCSPTISGNSISRNSSQLGGGGIYCAYSNAVIMNNTISDNKSTAARGGGICCYYSNPTISDNNISNNRTYSVGSGIYCNESCGSIVGNTISGNDGSACGGGIACGNSSPRISDNTLSGNWAYYGGGISCGGYCRPEIVNNVISGNSGGNGGAISCRDGTNPNISNNTIIGNSTNGNGGAIYCGENSNPSITANTITGNSASYNGGGIFCYESGVPTISTSIISGNSAGDQGGGIYCYYYSRARIKDNIITDNSASRGGGIGCYDESEPTIGNNAISGNSAAEGGGICCWHSNPMLLNNTISRNSAQDGGGVYCYFSILTITNTILWRDTGASVRPEIYVEGANPTVTYCDVEGGWEGVGNIDADPLFAGPYNDDFHLRWHSPCINTGDPSLTDPDGTRSDIGAFYFNLAVLGIVEVYPQDEPIVIPPQGGDVTYDGGVLNLSRGNLTVDIWAQAFVPGLTRPYRLWRYNDVTIPFADSIIRANLMEHVPSYGPSGDYTFVTYIGDFPSSIIDSSCMYFTKEGAAYTSGEGNGWEALKGWFNGCSEIAEATLPTAYSLSQNYPNPFNATTAINYQLPVDAEVTLEIYNLFGQKVATLVDSKQQAGYRSVLWDASTVSSGLYFYRLTAGDFTQTRRMMLVK